MSESDNALYSSASDEDNTEEEVKDESEGENTEDAQQLCEETVPTPNDDSCVAGAETLEAVVSEDREKLQSKYSFLVRICLPTETMPGSSTRAFIQDVIDKTGSCDVTRVIRCARVPSADYEIPMREHIFEVEVATKDTSQTSRSSSVSRFLQRFSDESTFGLHVQLLLELPKLQNIFNVIKAEDYVEVANMGVGSSPNGGLFLVRGNYISDHNNKPSNAMLTLKNPDFPAGHHSSLSGAHFEHDKKDLSIRFAIKFDQQEEDGLDFAGYRMQIQYSSIASITVHLENRGGGRNHNDLYFHLKNPPHLFEVLPSTVVHTTPEGPKQMRTINLGKYDQKYRQWMRVLQWPGNLRFQGCSHRALAECSVLHVAFKRRGNSRIQNEIFNIVSRIQARCPTIKVYFGAVAQMPRALPKVPDQLPFLGTFRADYALKAIISRGMLVTDEIFNSANTEDENTTGGFFFKRIRWCMKECSAACEEALELVLAAIEERRNISIERAFDRLYSTRVELYRRCEETQRAVEATRSLPPNCVFVRKVMVTPSRILPMPPDVMMTNRVVRHFGPEYALRLVFREENGCKLRVSDFGSMKHSPLLVRMIKDTMAGKVSLCGREYFFLAWSNSQMRDHGCYMYSSCEMPDGSIATIDTIRDWMGDFSQSKSVPKLMSRMGQCFTQAMPTVCLEPDEWTMESDVSGGAGHAETGEPFTFSDGVGRMSLSLARELAEKLELTLVPSCYQVRFKGFKGVLTIDRLLDAPGRPRAIFRKSQKKFNDSTEGERSMLEVVKYAMPSPMCLNRPLITILDYVSEKQGRKVHERMCARIHGYLEDELHTLSQMLLCDRTASLVLSSRLPISIDFRRLHQCGFSMTDEPFFRQMLVALYGYSIKQHLGKAKLEMPGWAGRSLYGVMDETGLLQYGQVFIQYSQSIRNASSNPYVHLGPVLVSKNPCHVAGDTRVFEAVWQPALSHLTDVIVFPRYGPRPHADEMAGSDLDGDEYSVIFDPDMFFTTNEPAMVFPKTSSPNFEYTPTSEDMANFFLTYMQNDSVGRVSNAHLHMADRRGLFDEACDSLARKCSIAVDFPKSGEPVDPFDRNEKLDVNPDFAEKAHVKQTYMSTRLNGQIYRRVKKIEEVWEICDRTESVFEGSYDQVLYQADFMECHPELKREAMRLSHEYAGEIQQLMDEYGIASEASVVSGKLSNPKRLAFMEKDDYSFYNTDKIVELRYAKIFTKYRRAFFEEFGDEEELKEVDSDGSETIRTDPSMREKARAWYIAAYIDIERSQDGEVKLSNRPCRSFAWLVWDVLAVLKRLELSANHSLLSTTKEIAPVPKQLGVEMRQFLDKDPLKYADFKSDLTSNRSIKLYVDVYGPELVDILFVIDACMEKDGLPSRCPITREHIARLLIQFCLGIYHIGHASNPLPHIPIYYAKKLTLTDAECDMSGSILEPGECLINFLMYLGSHSFMSVTSISLAIHDDPSIVEPCLVRPHLWRPLSNLAFKTRHEICVSGHFSALGMSEDSRVDTWAEGHEPVLVSNEVFKSNDKTVHDTLMRWTGVTDLITRSGPSRTTLVTMAGTTSARLRLIRLLRMEPMLLRYAIEKDQPPSLLFDEAM